MARKAKNGRIKGVIGIPREYFLKMAKHDYNNYRAALAREFYQNSVDAGATKVVVTTDEEKRTIRVEDNGCGMNMNTLRNKLLVLGGSKKAEGATGAFGKAKEVLFFAWEIYRIHTGDLMVQGSGAEYEIFDAPNHYNGTKCMIEVPKGEDFTYLRSHFTSVAQKFQTPSTKFIVDGREIACGLQRGRKVLSNEWCNLHHDPGVSSAYMTVRVNGQWMFEKYLGTDGIGRIIAELTQNSTAILTSNRDGINNDFSDQFDELVKKIVVEKKNALRPPKKIITEFFKGDGKVKVNWEKTQKVMQDALRRLMLEWKKLESNKLESNKDIKEGILSHIPKNDVLAGQRVGTSLADMKAKGRTLYDYENRFAFIGYKPDFVVVYEEKDQRKITKFMQTRKARVIAQAWTEVVKQVLLDIGWYGDITCGFDFRGDDRAAMSANERGTFFYINPYLLLDDVGISNPLAHRRLLREDLLLCAIHEVAHLREEYHDGDFVLRSEWVRAQTWKSDKVYSSIITSALWIK